MSGGTLHVVATPLGNLGDLSTRAAATLRAVDLVAAEDTRRTRALLSHLDAHPELVSFHAHSPPARLAQVLGALREGRSVALVTDAGTPTVSDPGADLVAAAREAGIDVVAVPGPSAVAAALSISGLPADRYLFLGFPPRKGTDRARFLEEAAASAWTVVCYEAPGRLVQLLADLGGAAGGARRAAVARELTKVHEELRTGTLADLTAYYGAHPPRGEVTVLLAGRGTRADAPSADPDAIRERAAGLLSEGLSRRDAAARLAEEFPLSRNEAYKMVMEL